MRILKSAFSYFGLVFGAGFVLGTLRTFWVVPRLGTRAAELMEVPIMLVVILAAAKHISRTWIRSATPGTRLAVGCAALLFMLFAEFGLVQWVRGMSMRQYLATRDPISGAAYYLLLFVFAILPVLLGREKALHASREN